MDTLSITRRMVVAAATAVLATTALIAAILVLVNRHEWWRGFLAAALVGSLTAVISVPPLVWSLRRGLYMAVGGYFATAGCKMLVSVGGGLLAVFAGGYPPLPTFLLIVVFYLALLAAETAVVARSIWSEKA